MKDTIELFKNFISLTYYANELLGEKIIFKTTEKWIFPPKCECLGNKSAYTLFWKTVFRFTITDFKQLLIFAPYKVIQICIVQLCIICKLVVKPLKFRLFEKNMIELFWFLKFILSFSVSF